MRQEIYERLMDFDIVEITDMLEISTEDILERFPERITQDQVPWVFDEGYN